MTEVAGFSAYRVGIVWRITPDLGVEIFYPYSVENDLTLVDDENDEVSEFDQQGRWITRTATRQEKEGREKKQREERDKMERWKALTPEVRTLLGGYFRQLAQLGCITGARDDETPSIFLVVEGECEFPKAPFPWDPEGTEEFCLGIDRGRVLEAVPDGKFQSLVWLERIEPLDAFEALRGLGRDHELSPWGGERTPGRLPQHDEAVDDWLNRVAAPAAYANAFAARLRRFNLSLGMALAMPPSSASATPAYALDGAWPLGDTALLAAPSGTGKTSLLHYFLHVASAPVRDGVRKTVLGREVPGQFTCAFISSEEPDWYFIDRQERFERLHPGGMIIRKRATRATFRQELEDLRAFAKQEGIERGILLYDSVTTFVGGDDTKSHVASEFHEVLLDFANETGWLVLGTHHTTKPDVRNFNEFPKAVRGSATHIDATRHAFGMRKLGGGLYDFGCLASNMPPDLAWLKQGESILCEANLETYTFEPVIRDDTTNRGVSGNDIERIATAIGERNAAGLPVHKSGNAGLYELRLPSLAGLSRNFIQQAIGALIEDGRVQATKAGLILIEPAGEVDEEPVL